MLRNGQMLDEKRELTRRQHELQDELTSTRQYSKALDVLWVIRSAFQEIDVLVDCGELATALTSIETVKSKIELFNQGYPEATIGGPLMQLASSKYENILKSLDKYWDEAIVLTDIDDTTVLSIAQHVEGIPFSNLCEAVQVTDSGKFFRGTKLERLLLLLDKRIIEPMLSKSYKTASIEDHELILQRNDTEAGIGQEQLFSVFSDVVNFLNSEFEKSLLNIAISKRFSHHLTNSIILSVLPSFFPEDPMDLDSYKEQLKYAIDFEKFLNELEWTKSSDIEQWTESYSSEWIRYRKGLFLDNIRNLDDLNITTFEISSTEQLPTVSEVAEEVKEKIEPKETTEAADDWSWDNNDEGADSEGQASDQEDDWGWGEQQETIADETPTETIPTDTRIEPIAPVQTVAFRKTVTNLPDQLLDIISRFLFEIEDLGQSTQASQVSDLATLFRVIASDIYTEKQVPLIIQYNDMIMLHENMSQNILRDAIPEEMEQLQWHAKGILSQLSRQPAEHIEKLLGFLGDLQSTADMRSSNRNNSVMDDLVKYIMEFAQGLSKYSASEETRELSGQLIEGAITELMEFVFQLGDIAEDESIELSKLFNKLSDFESLFPVQDSSIGSAIARYVPSWIKFQYFNEILQSSLVDIDYLLNQNALVDFTASELTGLVQALFAPSDQREKLLKEIANSRRV